MKKKINFCKICCYSDTHPLGLVINNNGVCTGCKIHQEKFEINWSDKYEKLKKIIKQYKSNKNIYDCVVPVSGGLDSYYIVEQVTKLGLKPLLVNYNKYFNTPLGIKNLSHLKTIFDLDLLTLNVNPNSIKKISKFTLVNYGNIYWHIIAGQTVFPIKIAIKYKIPLIIWGAHQGVEQVGMYSHHNEVEMSRFYRKNHDLFGVEAENLIENSNSINEEDIYEFLYPDDHTINKIGIRGIYLSNYIKWDPKSQHELMIKKYRYNTKKFSRTFDTYDHVDCVNYMNLHDLLKLVKHGYSKVTDHVTREIRHKRLNKYSGLNLIKKYEKGRVENLDLFCKWLNIEQDGLDYIIDSFRNNIFWKRIDINKWKFNGLSKLNSAKKDKKIKINFMINNKQNKNLKNYITIGKGWP